jgi:transcriptional regulator with XRE-family HTH domain
MANSPNPALERLATAVRRHRKRAGLTQAQLAAAIPCSDKTISAAETGRERPSRAMVIAVEAALRLSEGALLDLYELLDVESLPRWTRDWAGEERRASSLRLFQLAAVPGLLQTEDYARTFRPGDEAALRAHMERQRILDGETPPTVRVVLDETVLHRGRGGAQVMREQLRHLEERVCEHLTVQVVPAGLTPIPSGTFALAKVDGGEVAYVETAVRPIVTSSRDDLARLEEVWETIRTHVLPQHESLALIRRTAEERWS